MRFNTCKASLYLGMYPEVGPEQGKETIHTGRVDQLWEEEEDLEQ